MSLHPTRADHEIREAYGDRRYTPLGRATVEARVTDASEAVFLPAVYRIAETVWREGGPGALDEVVAYEGLYCHAGRQGRGCL